MAYKITEKCISCGACAGECPVGCISQGDEKYIIDNNSCIGCGACAGVCPVEAPVEELKKAKGNLEIGTVLFSNFFRKFIFR